MPNYLWNAVFAVLLVYPCKSVWAESSADAKLPLLPPVEVTTAGPFADPADRSLTRTRLERDDIARSDERDLNGVIRGLPGLTLQSTGARTSLSGLLLRGAAAGLGQVTFDDVPLFSSTTGGFNFTAFPADALESVDIVRGASAPRYGSRALSGVIRLHSRDTRENSAFLHLEGGSYGTLTESLGASRAGTGYRGTVTLHHDDQFDGPSTADPANGNTDGDDFWGHQAIARLQGQPTDKLHLQTSLFYNRGRADQDGAGRLPNGLTGAVDDRVSYALNEVWAAQTTAGLDLTPRWRSQLQLGYTNNHTTGGSGGIAYGFEQQLLLARWRNTQTLYHLDRSPATEATHLNLVWGGELRQEQGDTLLAAPGAQRHGARTTYTGLLELQGHQDAWDVYLGTTVDHYDDQQGSPATLYAGLSRALTDTLLLRASGGRGYRVPALQELLFFPAFGNPTLKPEQSWSAEMGLDWLPQAGQRLALTGFYHRYTDLIQVQFASTQPLLFASRNVPEAEIWGFEVEGESAWTPSLRTGFNYTYTHSRDLDSGRVLIRQPEQQGRLYLEWQTPSHPATLWMEALYRSSFFEDQDLQLRENAVARINAQVSYRLTPQWLLYVRGENLADDRTPELYSFTTRGAAVFAGLRCTL